MTKNAICEYSKTETLELEQIKTNVVEYPQVEADLDRAQKAVAEFLDKEKSLKESLYRLSCEEFLRAGPAVESAQAEMAWLSFALPVVQEIRERKRTRYQVLKHQLKAGLNNFGGLVRDKLQRARSQGQLSTEEFTKLMSQTSLDNYHRGDFAQQFAENVKFFCELGAMEEGA